MDAESITMMLNAWILAFRKLFEDIGLDRVIREGGMPFEMKVNKTNE